MLVKLDTIRPFIGDTPLLQLKNDTINLYTKLEFQNYGGSVKVRPAYYILKSAIERGEITPTTTIIESTSGNFGIALALLCKKLEIPFIPIIDSNINEIYEKILHVTATNVIKVNERDETGGYLLNRIRKVNELLSTIEDSFWTNQYANRDSFLSHYHGLGKEIADAFEQLDYVFIGVSSCGTIAGISRRLKEKFPSVKVIAVDSEGSVIFGNSPKKRYIPGIGSSMVPEILKEAIIDEVIHVPEYRAIQGCYEMLEKHALFVGGSSGSSYYAIGNYFADKVFTTPPNVLFICPDSGLSYVDTIYNKEWVENFRL
ncbi:2,3-diaminopropionate biosynthesis protein SbnA [Brevibacterium sp. JNUCC-42]|uniref:2,3-diaminopropionate biosynthesis protein SbnA n=1 Tax=Brevibacillus laterosporus TaxID=1465 RepID=A0A502IT43_BRELA|nr:2,3-diaminopropionate biosynthesis protein SbnA [Brevibacillus laterosporus]QOT00195.1 2,3-diaminopropionate biosynthesis protein SbnA [Brevibacterium sp. JNUCC-42]QDX94321.1 2,3-diaminopropionate biosynthesis protein SbnA [Brevibacillus laterosporus]RAP31086.1 Cysteine synthase [Brevibacillus laterosporus]TPG68255.1 2,3-diaminopropionate biosynthesis protein SbnA [Brevibacillus laterosporus]TPG88616.1 2,3-diaminopropionate biosynthesis protein SbnA [Brevibacillus laterosporus]